MFSPPYDAMKVSAAEKYAEVGDARPVCVCHGVPMRWHAASAYVAGGTWRCTVENRLAVRRSLARNRPRRSRGQAFTANA
jgi:hypothetical protein